MSDRNYIKVLEKAGFEVSIEFEDCQMYTPAGEDWHIPLFETVEQFKEYAESFNPYDEFVMFKTSTLTGLPDDEALLKDQIWKKKLLDKLTSKL